MLTLLSCIKILIEQKKVREEGNKFKIVSSSYT